jgi:hypothetical protein
MPKLRAVLRKPADPKRTGEPTQEQPVSAEPRKLKWTERAIAAIALIFARSYRRPGPLLSWDQSWGKARIINVNWL